MRTAFAALAAGSEKAWDEVRGFAALVDNARAIVEELDANPLIGPPTDEAGFAALGAEGVLAMVCDSTNALVDGHSGSEADVRVALTKLIAELKGRVAVACFAIHRTLKRNGWL